VLIAPDAGRKRFATTSGGDGLVRFADFDAALLIGLGWKVQPLAAVRARYGLHGDPDAPAKRYLVSLAARRAALAGTYGSGLAMTVAGGMRHAVDIPVVLLTEPFVSEAIADQPRLNGGLTDRHDQGLLTEYAALAADAKRSLDRFDILGQPATTHDGLFSHAWCEAGGVEIGGRGQIAARSDHRHMGPAYGALALRTGLERLAGL